MDTGTSNLFLSTIAKMSPWLFVLGLIVVSALAFVAVVWLVKSKRVRYVVIAVAIALLGFNLWGWIFSATHFVVGPREQAFFEYYDGTVGEPMSSGLHSKPLFGVILHVFPGQEIYQWCPEFTPGIAGGVEIKLVYCMRIDARKIDWARQFQAWNKGAAEIQEEWRKDLSGIVAAAVAEKLPNDLRLNRDEVASEIATATEPWFRDEGIPVSHLRIQNWDFTDPEVSKEYDALAVNALKMDAIAAAELTAQKQRSLELYLADTYAQVLAKRAIADRAAIGQLGLSPDAAVPYLVGMRQLAWLEVQEEIPNMVVTINGNGLPYTFGDTPNTPVVAAPTE